MKRYNDMFSRLQTRGEGAFIPFVMLGDPQPDLSLQIIDALIEGGADALELGIPFSDPLADGPTIQNAALRAFAANVTPARCFDMLAAIRARYPALPIGLLMYANLVYNRRIETFYATCARAGVDSVLVADVPFEESAPFREAAMRHDIAPVFICPPNADDELLRHIAAHGRGYTYLLSRAGVTGAEKRAALPLEHLVSKLGDYQAPPPIQGFGISTPEQVADAMKAGAAGAISGSAIVKVIEQHQDDREAMLCQLKAFARNLKTATVRPT
ncbi:TPA: tryptophan synthase subunit alpha [Klebsiella oxytoca]|nr:tryptophan synthase subunit alpha [Klebsiella oxytoca]HDS6515358.1 tryptophan synthase subunit alpha [Klebsiella oxytoca]HDT4984984.1 tryptophan synthase subunit alpha [Klebsiella oxytoca]